ncbi:unnamed protein product [Urochloa decumbens]|uniref:AAA+ ATPase domain-containing protein n=1 Tax=Urochloa decumbens TaxID=240449 RepID=A0ABC9CZC0_9POAL
MADLVMGAMSSIMPKLCQLLEEEYNLQTGVKERIRSLMLELELAQAALGKVAEVPWDQLDKQVQIWARHVREASYDMEDVLDTFLVRISGPESAEEKKSLRKHLKKMTNFFKESKARRKISGDVKNIMTHVNEMTEQCRRYKVADIGTRTATTSTIDPRLHAMYTQVNKIVGMDKSSGELMSMLQTIPQQGDVSSMKMKIVSIVGVGGLGKTTLAKAVYDKIRGYFNCAAFVPVGRNPDLKKIFKDILIDIDLMDPNLHTLDERQLIDRLRKFFLESKKRFLIVIDDIWEIESWETIKLAIDDVKNCGGRIIVTTRNMEVATKADEVYKLQPLPYDSSIQLLYARIYGDDEQRHVDSQPDEISDKFIRKCGGIPLAIITMASLLAGKPRYKWSQLYNTIDFGSKDNKEAENTMKILSFSYYDLPSHLRTCLLYLSAFPEDSVIDKGSLVWKWIAEGFVQENLGISLFDTGEQYFNDLINKSMIQAVQSKSDDNIIIGCRVHDVVLDFIRSMSREEFFFTVLDNDHDTLLLQSNVSKQSSARRFAIHNRSIGHAPHQTNHFEMPKLRSFVALRCVIEKWAPPLCSFTLLRVLCIEDCKPMDGDIVRAQHIGHLLHLRFLSLSGTRIDRVPEEIGALKFLQVLDLSGSELPELPSSCSSLKQLACLRITLTDPDALDGKVFSVEGMTSLEELEMTAWCDEPRRRLVKNLGCLRELRVLSASIVYDDETERDLVESLRHLHKLQSLNIRRNSFSIYDSTWQATELVLPCHLRHLSLSSIDLCKLPPCINPSCLPNISHLDLWLKATDEQDLKALGALPELRFLALNISSTSATISNINDSDGACYFPKLRCFRMWYAMVLFVANKEKESVSFHIWNGKDDIAVSDDDDDDDDDDEPERPTMVSASSDDELKSEFDELQPPIMATHPHDDELKNIPLQRCSILQHGIVAIAAVAYYLLAFFHLVLSFLTRHQQPLQKLGQRPSISNRGSAPTLIEEDQRNDSIYSKGNAAPSRFMPSLQVLQFQVRGRALKDHRYCERLGWEYLSSLQEINVIGVYSWGVCKNNKVEEVLSRAARVHPNRPTLRLEERMP